MRLSQSSKWEISGVYLALPQTKPAWNLLLLWSLGTFLSLPPSSTQRRVLMSGLLRNQQFLTQGQLCMSGSSWQKSLLMWPGKASTGSGPELRRRHSCSTTIHHSGQAEKNITGATPKFMYSRMIHMGALDE